MTYKITSTKKDTVTVNKISNKVSILKISDTVTDPVTKTTYKITKIANNTFKNKAKLKAVAVGNNIQSIGSNAFTNCKKLSLLVIYGKSLKTCGKNAFKGVPKGVEVRIEAKSKAQYQKIKKMLEKSGLKGAKYKYRITK